MFGIYARSIAFALLAAAAGPAAAQAPPAKPPSTPPPAGQRGFMMVGERALAFVPAQATPSTPVPLLILFHPAGGTAQGMLKPFLLEADKRGIALLAFQSKAVTWDLIKSHFRQQSQEATMIDHRDALPGGDRRMVEAGIAQFRKAVPVDARNIGTLGLSDGAAYALSYFADKADSISWSGAIAPKFGVIPRGVRGRGKPVFIANEGQAGTPTGAQSEVCPLFAQAGFTVRLEPYGGGRDIPVALATRMLDDWLKPETRPAKGSAVYNCGGSGKRRPAAPNRPSDEMGP